MGGIMHRGQSPVLCSVSALLLLIYRQSLFAHVPEIAATSDWATNDTIVFVEGQQDTLHAQPATSIDSLGVAEIGRFPERNIDRMIALFPGVVMQDNALFFRGGRSDETGTYVDGISITDVLRGRRGITISQDALSWLDVYTGNYGTGLGQGNSGLVNYGLRTGGSDISASLEYVSDNISLAGKSKAHSGSRRVGAYWYGHSEMIATLGYLAYLEST